MPVLKQCSRSAAFAFSPVGPHIAAGTVAGVIDMSFSTTSVLEVLDTDFANAGQDLKLIGGPTSAPERFQQVAWGRLGSDGDHKAGVIAGGLADGTLLVWDAAKVVGSPASPEGAGTYASKLTKHTGPIRGLEFNSVNSPHLLASGGADSDINIWNLTELKRASSYPASRTGANGHKANAEVTTLAWNHLIDHILATGAGGSVTVWDLKNQRPRSVLRDDNRNPRRCSAIAWHPAVATQIVVAYEDDHCPVLQLWDLRQTVSYVHEFQGHHKGILGLSWCKQDPGMILSTGKDSKTILWDTSGHELGEFSGPSFNFDVQWSPTNAGIFATSSYGGGDGQDGKVMLHSLASFSTPVQDMGNGYAEEAVPLGRVPSWLKRSAGASFGFGGKLASFSNEKRKAPHAHLSLANISLRQVTTEEELVKKSEEFEAAIAGGDKAALVAFCESKAQQSHAQEAETWRFLQIHFEQDARRTLMIQLGFEGMLPPAEAAEAPQADAEEAAEQLGNLGISDLSHAEPALEMPDGDGTDFFDNEGPLDSFDQHIAADHDTKPPSKPSTPKASPRAAPEKAGKNEEEIQRALFVGNFAAALDACFEADRMADALVIGLMGQGQHLVRAQAEYMKRQPRPYMRIVKAVMDNDLLHMIKTRPLSAWKETLAMLTSYSDGEEWAGLCDALARRLAAAGQLHAATLAWICAGNVDQTIRAWTQALQKLGVTVSGLQGLMEQAVVLGMGVQQQSATPALADLLSQYASILASQGRMGMALEYLEMIPGESSGPIGILKDRIFHSGNAEIAPGTAAPPYPFVEEAASEQLPAAPAQNPAIPPQAASTGGTGHDFYNQNAYRTSGAYSGNAYAAPANQTFMQPPPTQPAYQDYYSSQQPGYDYGQQQASASSYPVGGGSYTHAGGPPPTSAPPLQQSYSAAPKPVSPPSYAQPSYASVDQTSFGSAYQAPSQPQIAQRPPQGGAQQWQASESSGATDWNQNAQQFVPSPRAQPQSIVPPPNVFVPSRSSAHSAPQQPPPQQVQPPQLFVPTSSAASKPPSQVAVQPPQFSASQPQQFAAPQPSQFAAPQAHQPSTPPAKSAAAQPKAPTGPPANVNISSVDTSTVPADAQGIVKTLRATHDRCMQAATSVPGKRREIEDTGRRLGQLFWRLNAHDISPRVQAALKELCQAMEARDYATASQKQAALTSSDWEECSGFLTGLKRLIKAAQASG